MKRTHSLLTPTLLLAFMTSAACDGPLRAVNPGETGTECCDEPPAVDNLLFDGQARVGAWAQAATDASLQGWSALGVDMYVGHWEDFSDEDQALLDTYTMPYVLNLGQFEEAAEPGGVMIDHEPDINVQVPPQDIIDAAADYKDQGGQQPVYIFFGKGISIEGWTGLGSSNGEAWSGAMGGFEYYKQIAASEHIDGFFFDYYPFNSAPTKQYTADCPTGCSVDDDPQLVVDALLRLKEYSGGKPVYPTLSSSPVKLETGLPAPTLAQNSTLVDELLDNGADGIIWFSHVFDNGSYVTDRYPLTDAGQQDGTADMVRSVNEHVREYFGLSNQP